MFLHLGGTLDERDLLAGQDRRFAELLLQVFAVVDQTDLEILQVVAHAQLANGEDHCERFTRPLGVPDDARPILRRFRPSAAGR